MIALQSHGLKQIHQPQSQEEAMDKEPLGTRLQTHLDNNPLFVTDQCTVPNSSTNHRPSSIPLYQILCLGHHVSSVEIQTLLSLEK